MNQAQPLKHTTKPEPAAQEQSKAPWHRPTVTFMPLQATAFETGSFPDGSSSTTAPLT